MEMANIIMRSPYTPFSIYFRGTINPRGLGVWVRIYFRPSGFLVLVLLRSSIWHMSTSGAYGPKIRRDFLKKCS